MKNWQDFSLLRTLGGANRKDYQPGFPAQQLSAEGDRDELLLEERDPDLDMDLAESDLLASVLAKTGDVELRQAPRAESTRSSAVRWALPGFEGKCRVTTNFGELPIEALRRRDMVKTISGAFREVKWIDAIRLDADFMARHTDAHPVVVRAKALGGVFPAHSMMLSPGQKICVPKGSNGHTIRTAAQMEGSPNIQKMRRAEITYYRFHCGDEEQVCIEGAYFCTAPD